MDGECPLATDHCGEGARLRRHHPAAQAVTIDRSLWPASDVGPDAPAGRTGRIGDPAASGRGRVARWRKAASEARLAIHLGEVLVAMRSNLPTASLLAVADTLSLPVHLLGHATPGEILLSPQVAHLVEGWFELQARQVPLRDEQSDHSTVYRVVGLDRRRFPSTRFGARAHSRFIGR